MSFVKQANANTAATILAGLKKRNMEGWFCETCEEAVQKALELMPEGSVLSWGGSMSIQECGLMDAVKARSYTLIDRAAATTPEEKRELYAKAVLADYYLMSTNAIDRRGTGQHRRPWQPRGLSVLWPLQHHHRGGNEQSRSQCTGRHRPYPHQSSTSQHCTPKP